MEEGDFQPGISVRVTASPEGADIDWDGMDQLLLSGNNAWPEVAIDASSSPSFFACSSIFPSDATTTMAATPATTNTCLSQPSITMASEGAMVDLDLDQLLSGDNPWLQVATIASSSTSFFASPSTFLLDATTNGGTPATTNTCLIQPSISVPHTTPSQGAAVDFPLEQLLSADNAWLASSSPSFFVCPSIFPSDAKTTAATPSSANTCGIQTNVWAPVERGDNQLVMTTTGQPFTVNQSSDSLIQFRNVSTQYQLSADVASEYSPSPASRVFTGMLPEWSLNLDARYFTRYECPMLNHAQDLGVRGTLAVPVFDEVFTTQDTSEINAICSTLQVLNLRSTEDPRFRRKFNSASYIDALSEIVRVLKATCITHKLPLAQTWVTCAQRGKRCRRYSDENYRHCISTIDIACYVNDPRMQIFHEACSEHHLLRGQGVAGKAFATNQPCFLPDIGSSSKPVYPLSHHAKIFRLKGAVAIRLRCTRTGVADFMLEFFLPTDCEVLEEQVAVLDSLSKTFAKSYRYTTCGYGQGDGG